MVLETHGQNFNTTNQITKKIDYNMQFPTLDPNGKLVYLYNTSSFYKYENYEIFKVIYFQSIEVEDRLISTDTCAYYLIRKDNCKSGIELNLNTLKIEKVTNIDSAISKRACKPIDVLDLKKIKLFSIIKDTEFIEERYISLEIKDYSYPDTIFVKYSPLSLKFPCTLCAVVNDKYRMPVTSLKIFKKERVVPGYEKLLPENSAVIQIQESKISEFDEIYNVIRYLKEYKIKFK